MGNRGLAVSDPYAVEVEDDRPGHDTVARARIDQLQVRFGLSDETGVPISSITQRHEVVMVRGMDVEVWRRDGGWAGKNTLFRLERRHQKEQRT